MALGRTKNSRRQKAEPPPTEPAEPDHELESYLAALAPEESVETTGSGRRFGGSEVYQLRLPLMANERLKELAAKQGTSPAALARDWVLQHLADEPPSAPAEPSAAAEPSAPAWPGQETRDFSPVNQQQYAGELYGSSGYGDVEQTEEITVPHKRFGR